jgi:hypothetical protein
VTRPFLVVRRVPGCGHVDIRTGLDSLGDTEWSASPLLHLGGVEYDALPRSCFLLFLFPDSVREVGHILAKQFGQSRSVGLYLTHGLASVVCIGDGRTMERIRRSTEHKLLAWERWSVRKGAVRNHQVEIWQKQPPPLDPLAPIADDGLPEIAATQVRQFNANIAVLFLHVGRYAPDLLPLLYSSHQSMCDVAESLRKLNGRSNFQAYKDTYSKASELIEVNASLTMLLSQAFSAVPSLLYSRYCVGEYSLLGIGGAIRGIWRLYKHLEDVFFKGGVVQRVRGKFPNDPPFSVFKDRSQFKPDDWSFSPLATGGNEDDTDTVEYQIPYFSSRWGFHETLHTLTVSWQCIHSGARPEWNLLTISHEFLHTHVHELLDTLFPASDAERSKLVALYNGGGRTGTGYANGFVSAQVALVVALVQINNFAQIVPEIRGTWRLGSAISPKDLEALRQEHWWYVNEIIVHVLDFLYIYKGNEVAYIDSLWQSWSLVPKVAKSIRHYLQRTICALAATCPAHADSGSAFRDAFERLTDVMRRLASRKPPRIGTPVMKEALKVCSEESTRQMLRVEFEASYYIVCLARAIFHDNRLHSKLLADDLAAPGKPGKRYALEAGDFPDKVIESPVGFLLDRFAVGTPEERIAFASVWQLLILVEGSDG